MSWQDLEPYVSASYSAWAGDVNSPTKRVGGTRCCATLTWQVRMACNGSRRGQRWCVTAYGPGDAQENDLLFNIIWPLI